MFLTLLEVFLYSMLATLGILTGLLIALIVMVFIGKIFKVKGKK